MKESFLFLFAVVPNLSLFGERKYVPRIEKPCNNISTIPGTVQLERRTTTTIKEQQEQQKEKNNDNKDNRNESSLHSRYYNINLPYISIYLYIYISIYIYCFKYGTCSTICRPHLAADRTDRPHTDRLVLGKVAADRMDITTATMTTAIVMIRK